MPRQDLIQTRRGTAAAWTIANPVLASGEWGLESDTGKIKMGDGATAWPALAYVVPTDTSSLATAGALAAETTRAQAAETALQSELAVLGGLAPIRLLGVHYVDMVGHSYLAGFGLTNSTNDWGQKVTDALGATAVNNAVSNARVLQRTVAQGGWLKVLTAFPRASRLVAIDDASVPASQLMLIDFGINDLADIASAKRAKYFGHGFRLCISNALTWSRWDDADASVVYAGTWNTTVGATDFAYAGTTHNVGANGSTATITVPAKVPAGTTIALGFLAGNTGTGIATVTHNGTSVGTVDTTDATLPYNTIADNMFPYVLRVPGCAGGHTIVITMSSIAAGPFSTGMSFDWYAAEAQSNLPLVAVMEQPHLPAAGYSNYAGHPFYPIGDADVDQINAAINATVAEFNTPRVFGVPITSLSGRTDIWNPDSWHFNVLGHAAVAALVCAQLAASGYTPADAVVAARS